MTRQLRVRVVTPQSVVIDEACDAVVAPLPDGWIGVLPGHAPFQARLLPGQLVLRQGDAQRMVATIGGVIGVDGEGATILTGIAAPDMDLARLEHDIGTQAAQLNRMEGEAEAHFDRLYRAMANTLDRRDRGHS